MNDIPVFAHPRLDLGGYTLAWRLCTWPQYCLNGVGEHLYRGLSMLQKKEIWLMVDTRGMGGIETHILQLAMGLKKSGYEPRVIRMKAYGSHPLTNLLRREGIAHTALNYGLLSLAIMAFRGAPTLIHSHGYKAGLLSRLIGLLLSIPTVHSHHAGEKCSGRLALYTGIDKMTAFLSSQNVSVSKIICASLPCDSTVIKNFIESDHTVLSSGSRIAFVGRLSQEKAPEAFITLAKALPSESFHMYGDGPMAEVLSTSTPRNCILHGRSDMNLAWGGIGILVICSKYEGLPLVAIEAMARGVIVLSYDVGDLGELIESGVNGWIVAPRTDEGLEQGLRRILALPEGEIDAVRKRARMTVVDKYSTSAVLPELLAVYGRACRIPSTSLKRNVLIVHYGDDWLRGSEYCVIELCKRLKDTHWRPVVWCNSECFSQALKANGVEVIVDRFTILAGWSEPRSDVRNYVEMRNKTVSLLREHRIELIHTNNGAPNQWVVPIAKHCGIPVLCQLHSSYQFRDRLSLLINEADAIVGVSKAVIEPFRERGGEWPRNCHVVSNGVDTKQQYSPVENIRTRLAIPVHCPVMITVGSLIERKGMDLLIQTLPILAGKFPVHLVVIGDGEELARLQDLSRSLRVEDRVHWMGEQSNVGGLLRSGADVFVSGAREEAFGLVLAEAGLAGLPIVAPMVGGIVDVLDHGRCGVLVEPEDSRAIAEAVQQLLSKPHHHRRALAQRMRLRVHTHYDSDDNAQKLIQFYDQLCQDKASKSILFELGLFRRMFSRTLGKIVFSWSKTHA